MNNYSSNSIVQTGCIPKVVCQEKGRKYVLTNKSRSNILKIHVDGFLINEKCRCDYAVDVSDGDKVFLVELKGKNKEHAFEQLYKTLKYFREHFGTEKYYCRVVLSKDSAPKTIGKFEKLIMKAKKEEKCIDYDSACVVYSKDVV